MIRFWRGLLVRCEFDFNPANKILRCRVSGEVTDDHLRALYAENGKQASLMNPKAGLLDFSAVTSFHVSAETIQELAHQPPALPGPIEPRVVIAPTPVIFGMSRMFEIVGDRGLLGFHVVRTEQEAFAILGVSNPKFQPVSG